MTSGVSMNVAKSGLASVLPEGGVGLPAMRKRIAGRSWVLLAVCSLGIAVEFSWALLDGNIIPVLRSLGVPYPIASCAFVGGPLAALLLQPAIGRASDNYHSAWGPRRPFIALLGGMNLAAVAVLSWLCRPSISAGAGFLPVALIFLATATMDCCADLVLTPGRALLGDLADAEAEAEAQAEACAAAQQVQVAAQRDTTATRAYTCALAAAKEIKAEAIEHANQRWTLGQALGRMGAYFLGALPLQRYFNDLGLLSFSGSDAQQAQTEADTGLGAQQHAQAFFCTGLAVMSCCYLSALLAGSCGKGCGSDGNGDVHAEGKQENRKAAHEHHNQLLEAKTCMGDAKTVLNTEDVANSGATDNRAAAPPSWGALPRMIRGLCVVQAIGWFAMTCQEMYWTSLLGETRFLGTGLRTSFVGLAGQSIVSLVATAALPAINSRLGMARAFLVAELLFLALLTLPLLIDYRQNPTTLTFAISLSGVTFAVHDNNPYVLLEARLDAEEEKEKNEADPVVGVVSTSHRGYMLALLNNTLPAAVTVAGLCSGSAIALLGSSFDGSGLARFLCLVGVGGFCIDCYIAGPASIAWSPVQTWEGVQLVQHGLEDGGVKNDKHAAGQTSTIGECAPLVQATGVDGAGSYSS